MSVDRREIDGGRRESTILRVWLVDAMKAAQPCWVAERSPLPPILTGKKA